MKKSVSLKLIVFSFLLVTASVSYSTGAPKFGGGSATKSIVAGVDNIAIGGKSSAFGYKNATVGEESSAFGYNNTANGERSSAFGHWNEARGEKSSAFGSQYKVTGEASGAFGVGKATWNGITGENDYDYINEGKHSYMFGNYNKIASGTENNLKKRSLKLNLIYSIIKNID